MGRAWAAAVAVLAVLCTCQIVLFWMDSHDWLPGGTAASNTSVARAPIRAAAGAAAAAAARVPACAFTRGSWCEEWHLRPALAAPLRRPPPAADKPCPNNCSGIGNCAADLGVCYCPAAWGGPDCARPVKRPCTDRLGGLRESGRPYSHIGPDKLDLNLTEDGFQYGRCAGVCDDEYGRCYCRGPGPYGRVPAPEGSPPGTPAINAGRPTSLPCNHPKTGPGGAALPWGAGETTWEQLYGPDGWCVAVTPSNQAGCPCAYDGWDGPGCGLPTEQTCLNQCSGRGACEGMGFCRCRQGWYGTDCAHPSAAAAAAAAGGGLGQPAASATQQLWLRDVAVDAWTCYTQRRGCLEQLADQAWREAAGPGAAEPPAGGTDADAAAPRPRALLQQQQQQQQQQAAGRPRPLIYVYHIPDSVVSHILQYRLNKQQCVWRVFRAENVTTVVTDAYQLEMLLPDLLLGSAHRTLDPEEADFFYVPVLATCWMTYLQGELDWPWFELDSWSRVKAAVVMYQRALDFVRQSYPYWNASRGADHIWLFAHDEGACWAPADVYANSIILTQWGRNTPDNFPSHTNYGQDNYSVDVTDDKTALPHGLHAAIGRHRCYTPGKDIVVPPALFGDAFPSSPFLAAPQQPRDKLAYHRGRTLPDIPHYSLGVRQALAAAAAAGDWGARHGIWMGPQEPPGERRTYSQHLASSVFCFVLQGDGFTTRFVDSLVHGCVPAIVLDVADPPFGHELDWDAFSVRIPVAEIPKIPQILASVPADRVQQMQRAIRRVWSRMVWLRHPLIVQRLHEWQRYNRDVAGTRPPQTPEQQQGPHPTVGLEDVHNDAFSTLMQVLHARLPKQRQRLD